MNPRIIAAAAIMAITAATWLAINEFGVPMRQAAATNVALHKPVRADSIYDGRYPPQNAVDGDHESIESRWLSARTNAFDWSSAPHWIEIDLGRPYTVVEMRFWSGAHGEYKWPPADFVLQALVNGGWTEVIAQTGNREAAYARDFAPVVTDRVRLLATRGTDVGALRLYEIEVLGY